jgi:hypothetical protein
MLGAYLCPSIETLRYVRQQALVHGPMRIPTEEVPEVRRVPNPLDNQVWVAKMVAWLSVLLFQHASYGYSDVVMLIDLKCVIMQTTVVNAFVNSFDIPSELLYPLSDFVKQIMDDHSNPYEMDADVNHVDVFLHDCANAFLQQVRKSWQIFPHIDDDENPTRWRFDWGFH